MRNRSGRALAMHGMQVAVVSEARDGQDAAAVSESRVQGEVESVWQAWCRIGRGASF